MPGFQCVIRKNIENLNIGKKISKITYIKYKNALNQTIFWCYLQTFKQDYLFFISLKNRLCKTL